MKAHFFIDKSKVNKSGFVAIRLKLNFGSKSFYKNIEKIKPRYWNEKSQRVRPFKPGEPDNNFKKINGLLDSWESKINDYFNSCTLNNITIDEKLIDDFLSGNEKKITKEGTFRNFYETYQEFIEIKKSSKAPNTIKGYKLTYNFIKKFDETQKYNLTFDKIDLTFFDTFRDYAFNVEDNEINYFATTIAKLKTFLNWCYERNYIDNLTFKKFSAPEKEKPIVCLDIDEFKALYTATMPTKKLEKVRDMFCFGCLTGLRFEDMKQLRREHIQNNYIVKLTEKTESLTKIPIVEFTKKIIDKYKEQSNYILPRISNQKFNDYIKNCCQLAGIDKLIMEIRYKGNKTIETPVPKYKLISAHNSRKTFITLSFYFGMDIKTIMEIATIKKDKILNKYLKISDEMKSQKMNDAWGKLDL